MVRNLRTKKIGVILFVIIAMVFSQSAAFAFTPITGSATSNFSWTVGGRVSQTTLQADGAPCEIWDNGSMYCISSGGWTPPYVWKGTSVDNMVLQYQGTLDSSFGRPHGDDNAWLVGGGWRDPDTGKWYAVVHVEYNYLAGGNASCREVGIASSTDLGRTWHYEGDVLTSDNPDDLTQYTTSNWIDAGCGDMTLYVDTAGGYFYIYYLHTWSDKYSTLFHSVTTRVARCAISDKMAPGKWYKFYNGQWNQPGLGGYDSPVVANMTSRGVSYNTYLGKYVMIGAAAPQGDWEDYAEISTCTDLNKQNWTVPQHFLEGASDYNWIQSSDGTDPYTSGQTFRYYTGNDWGMDFAYYPVTLSTSGTTVTADAPQSYPDESVNDHNPYADWSLTSAQVAPYNFFDGFSSVQGHDNWYYLEWNGSTYNNLTWNKNAHKWVGSYAYTLIYPPYGLHPDTNDVALGYKVPATGTIRITGNPHKEVANGDGVYIKIMQNSTQVWPAGGWQYITGTDTSGLYHDISISANQNDMIYFVVNKNGNNNTDGICWNPTIQYTNTYNAFNDFSSVQGTKCWYNMENNGSAYGLMTWNASTGQWNGTNQYNLIWNGGSGSSMHPDAFDTVKAFKAPAQGTVTLTGNPKKAASGGDGVNVKIMKNNVQVWPTSGWQAIAGTDTTGVSYDVNTTVNEGDFIYFIVNKNGNRDGDETIWSPEVNYAAGNIDLGRQIEGENYSGKSGDLDTETCLDYGGGSNIMNSHDGSYLVFNNINLGSGAARFDARVSAANDVQGGKLEIRLDSLTGTLVGTVNVNASGGWQTWQTLSCLLAGASGTHDIYLKWDAYNPSNYGVFNLNWFKFDASDLDIGRQIEAESCSGMSSDLGTENCADSGRGLNIMGSHNGSYLVFNNINLGSGTRNFIARVAAANDGSGGKLEVRLDSLTGTLLGTVDVAPTGGWQTWQTDSVLFTGQNIAAGNHDIYLKWDANNPSDYGVFNLNWFEFTP